MNLSDVIDALVEERGLDKEQIATIVCEGMRAAYSKKYPELNFVVIYNKKSGQVEVFTEKTVVSSAQDKEKEISLKKAKVINPKAKIGSVLPVPFEQAIGRIEILVAKQVIANKIRELEQSVVYEEYKDQLGDIISGVLHKKERGGFVIKINDVMALLPKEGLIPGENLVIGHPVKVLLKEVLSVGRGDFQLILDRASADFVRKLIKLEIPEVFEGLVEIKKIVRIPGYKTKAVVVSKGKDIDPVGTCIGVGGARIKPILKELDKEKIDLIEWTDVTEDLVKRSLKPAEIDRVVLSDDKKSATVWLSQDQRSFAIGKMGQNILLASKLVGLDLQLQDVSSNGENESEKLTEDNRLDN
ncbi:MAG: transcription termination factor NusA [bacterium]